VARRRLHSSRLARTSIYRVQPDEQGVVLRFGNGSRHQGPAARPLAWPIDVVLFPKVTKINQIQLAASRPAPPPLANDRTPGASGRR